MRELEHKKGAKKIFDAIFNKIHFGNKNIEKEESNIKNIKRRKKILIGNNMPLDLLFLISKFGERLPDDYKSFKHIIKNKLECIYDTKYLFEEFKKSTISQNNIAIKEIKSDLDSMYPYLKSSFGDLLNIKIRSKEDLLKEEKYHTTGYNSFITGACFLYMKYATRNMNFLYENKNKIYLMNSLYKSMDMSKDEDDYIVEMKNPNENNFIFKGIEDINDIFFEKIFGKVLWENHVVKLIKEEKNNILVVFTNLDEKSKQDKDAFENIANNKINKDKFVLYTLEEYRNKYMKKPNII